MMKKIHLVGEINNEVIDNLIQQLETNEHISKIEYKEQTHDLHIQTDSKDYMSLLAEVIEELRLNIKAIERKKSNDKSEKPFEKRVFLFSDLKSSENAVFLTSYLLNDPQIREAKFDHNQKILTLETNDPFIYTKLRHVIDAFGENIEITENYIEEQTFDYRLMYRYLYVALLLFSFSLYIVTRQEPTIVTLFSGIVMCGLLSVRLVIHAAELIKAKDYLNSNNLILLGAFLLLLFNRPLDAAIALFVFQYLQMAFKSFERQIINLLVSNVDNLIRIVKIKVDDEVEEKQVEEVEHEDILILEEKNLSYFEGIIVEGEAKVDRLLMHGETKLAELKAGDRIAAGDQVVEGQLSIKIVKTYPETQFNQIYDWSPKRLVEKGYLETREKNNYLYFTYSMLAIGAVLVAAGLFMKNTHLSITGLVMITTCYPFALSLLSPYVYDNAMIEAMGQRVLLKDENSLSKLVEWLRKQKTETINESLDIEASGIKFNRGNYLDETIRNECDIIYHNKESLIKFFLYIKDFDKQWVYFKYISYGVKIITVLLFYINFFSFVGALIANVLLAFMILVAMKHMLDKGVG
ncbi:MAG: hypothetical protein ACLRVU_06665 [Beduini sp.]|uniref:P-type ATPase n=1 Tax=Beduini sp. TaxID=1922300 RepID=UPI0039A07E2E